MKRATGLRAISEKRRAKLAAAGIVHPGSTFAPKPAAAKPGKRTTKRPTDTGPPRSTIELVDDRSGKWCEWPGCKKQQTDRHHRLNRKSGGRHGDARVRVNGAAWLLGCCRVHHAYVTSPFGERRQIAESMGWLLREHQNAAQVPVRTRHHRDPVWLDNAGKWHLYEEGAA